MNAQITITNHNPQRDPIKLWQAVISGDLRTNAELIPMPAFYVLATLGCQFAIIPGTKLVVEVEVTE